jgi:hypothetical protein
MGWVAGFPYILLEIRILNLLDQVLDSFRSSMCFIIASLNMQYIFASTLEEATSGLLLASVS